VSPQKAFNFYWGVRLHFLQPTYSMIKYGTNTKAANSKYEVMSTDKKYRFDWLSKKYPESQDLAYACIGCEFEEISVQYAPKEEIVNAFFKFKSRRESLTYTLKSQISKYKDSEITEIDKILLKYLAGEYSPEFMLLLAHNNDKLQELYDNKNLSWAKSKILKIIKYSDFFNTQKFYPLLGDTE
jgi:hypothetical protein